MEQLKRINILRHAEQRNIETECIINNLFQCIGRNILAKKGICHAVGYLLKTERINAIVKLLWQRFDGEGHEEPLVCSKSLYHGFFKSGFGGLFVGTIIFHIKLKIKELKIKGCVMLLDGNQHIGILAH